MSGRDEVVLAIEDLIRAVGDARAEMRRAEQSLRRVARRIEDGETVESLIALRPPGEKRKAFLEALEEVHRTRHTVRRKVFTHAQERGVSVAELARAWGISRQLASRYLKEETAATEVFEMDAELLSDELVVPPEEAVLEGVAAADDGSI
jgi:hypothetical protein